MSYGVNAPQGLQPFSYLNGSTWSGQSNTYPIASGYTTGGTLTGIFTGDPVTVLNNGTIGIATVGGPLLGVFIGVKYTDTTGTFQNLPYWTNATTTLNGANAQAMIVDDPNVLYNIQVSTSAGAAGPTNAIGLAQTNFNNNANLNFAVNTFNPVTGPNGIYTPPANPGVGNTRTGQSGWYLDFNTLAATANLQVKLISLTPLVYPGQVLYSTAGGITVGVFNNAVVALNNDIYKGGTGTLGV